MNADVWENLVRWKKEREPDDKTIELSGTKESNPDFWRDLSPQNFLTKIIAPILIFHGDNDESVPKAWSDDLVTRMKALGKDITYVEYPAEAHEFGPRWTDFMKKSADFFREQLSPLSS
jgi:dipeptidyl aminopeptidase/acylaminoacyl peptidase